MGRRSHSTGLRWMLSGKQSVIRARGHSSPPLGLSDATF